MKQAFESGAGAGGGGGQASRFTRRSFIKRTGGATVAAMVAWNQSTATLRAEEEPCCSGEGNWWPATAVFSLPVELDHDAVLAYLFGLTTTPPPGQAAVAVSSLFANIGELRTHLGWTAGQKTKRTFTQTVHWEEKLTNEDGTGDQPTCFRRLKYTYGGNHLINVGVHEGLAGLVITLNNGTVGMILFTEGSYPSDNWQLGDFTINPLTPGITGGASNGRQWYPSGSTDAIQPDDKAEARFGDIASNFQPQVVSLETTGEWEGTNEGTCSLKVRHGTSIFAVVVATLKHGHSISRIVNGAARLSIETAKSPIIEITDWQNDRAPSLSDGTYYPAGEHPEFADTEVNDWFIRVERPGLLVE